MACVAIWGKLEALIDLEQRLQIPSLQWEENDVNSHPARVQRQALAFLMSSAMISCSGDGFGRLVVCEDSLNDKKWVFWCSVPLKMRV